MAATVLLASCAKEGNEGAAIKGKEATLNITLDNPTLSRAAGTAPSTDNTVTNFTAIIIDDAGNVGWETHVTGTGLSNFAVTTKATEIYVIANAGDQTGLYTTKTALLAAIEDLGAMYTNRWATGSSTIDWSGGTTASETVAMQFIAARIVVKVDNKMTGYTGAAGTVIIDDVAILNARGQSKLFGSSLVPAYAANKTYMMGMANPSPALPSYPATGTFTVDATNLNNSYTYVSSVTSDYYFYAYETDVITASNPATIITLIGTDAAGKTVYWPVHLSTGEDWKTGSDQMTDGIVRGKSYNVTITLTGDATGGGGGGTTDPFEPVVSAALNATLSITDWTAVNLVKEF